jgi:2-keto-4-pentenoate hydratase/2-oxohepta-3-ene-1,7-dioic acid hydratase in catechol pathway
MRLARVGAAGDERPVVVFGDEFVHVDHLVGDWTPATLDLESIARVTGADLHELAREPLAGLRIGAPVGSVRNIICIGLNYALHAAEIGAEHPFEPIVFTKAPGSLVGPFDAIVVPPGSTTTDYEAELAIVIGAEALYLDSPADARAVIAGYSISQDVSERDWQNNHNGQWFKGKSFPTFNPMGPVIVTPDEFEPDDAAIWSSVDGEERQSSRTSDLIYGIDHIVWYLSQFMQLSPGDIINTGTPAGVAMGRGPEAYLKPGQLLTTGIEGIGEMSSPIIAHDTVSKGSSL